jgi:hypothetical protein
MGRSQAAGEEHMTPQERELMQMALDALEKNKRTHYYCEDTWYSCPKHEDGCANDAEGDDCNCGADRINTVLDKTIKALRARLEQPEQAPTNNGRYLTGYKAQPEQEPPCKTGSQCVGGKCERCAVQPEQGPVAWVRWDDEETYWDVRRNPPSDEAVHYLKSIKRPPWVPAYPHPPQREWQGLTDEEIIVVTAPIDNRKGGWVLDLSRAIEAKLREKNA